MFDLTAKKALITGSSQGIGKEIAKAFSEHGAEVYVHGAKPSQKLDEACKYANAAGAVTADLFDSDAAEKLYFQTGDIDILILNASIQIKKPWNEYTEDEFDKHVSCNLKSSYFIMKRYIDGMKKRGFGRIITIGSVNQYNNHPELSLYAVTKAAQMKLVENIAPFAAPYGITVNNIAPGAIATPRNSEALSNPNFYKDVINKIPVGYIGAATDINAIALLLASEEGRYITGSDIVADGGMRL